MKRPTLFLLLLFATAFGCFGQRSRQPAVINGVIVDAISGEPLERVEIELEPTGSKRVSDNQGRFNFAPLPPGTYILRVTTVGYRMLRERVTLDWGETKDFDISLAPDVLRQTVQVRAAPFEAAIEDSPSVVSLRGEEARNLASVLADDPLRAVQGLPAVQSNDDFKSQFSMRGADFHRIGLYLDSILLHSPFDEVEDEETSGSLTVVSGDTLDSIELSGGAYPVRYSDSTAGALDMQSREGNRERRWVRASASASNASFLAEGPIGQNHRGAWLASARKSYLQYLVKRISTDPSLAFGFYDFQGRADYDLTSKNHLSLTAIDSHSGLDRTSETTDLGLNSVMTSNLHYTLANLAWTYSAGPRFFVVSRVAGMREKFDNINKQEIDLEAGHYSEAIANSNGAWIWEGRDALNFGMELRHIHDSGFIDRYQYVPLALRVLDNYRGTGNRFGAYVEQSWKTAKDRLRATVGVRWDRHGVDQLSVVSPQASLTLRPWSSTWVDFSAGQYAQYPDLEWFFSQLGSRQLLPERANSFTAAIEHRFDPRTRLRIELYDRQDRDLLFRPWADPRLLNGQVFSPPVNAPYANSMRAYARGVEFLLQRRSANRLSGWISYQLGFAHSRDGLAGVAFPSDYDQRHTVNVYSSYRLRPTVNLSVKAEYGSGFPIPGFFQVVYVPIVTLGRPSPVITPVYALSESRNASRLAAYQRTDFRINKVFIRDRWKMTLYAEVINVTDRENKRFGTLDGFNPSTGQAYLRFDSLIPVLPSAGIVAEF